MKTLQNTAFRSNLAILIFSGLVTLTLGFAVFGTANAEEFRYKDDTIEAQRLFEGLTSDLTLADSEYQAAYQVLEAARIKRNSVQQSVCAEQIVLAQLKYRDTDPTNEAEQERLHDSALEARTCLGVFQ